MGVVSSGDFRIGSGLLSNEHQYDQNEIEEQVNRAYDFPLCVSVV